jgi:hypothetical protein
MQHLNPRLRGNDEVAAIAGVICNQGQPAITIPGQTQAAHFDRQAQ